MSRCLLWQEEHPTVHGGAESWLKDTAAGLKLCGHTVAWLSGTQIQRAVEQFKPDAVILGTLHCFVGLEHVAWLAEQKIPTVWFMHDYWPICGDRMLLQQHNQSDRSCEAVEGVCQNSCGSQAHLRDLVNRFYVVTGCDGAADILQRNGVHVRRVVEEGIDTDLFCPDNLRHDARVIYASAVGDDVWKGLHILRQAVDGTDMRVRFLTGRTRSELAEGLRHAAIYVFPSVYEEIWGLSLTEAMASGCFCIASDVAGARAQSHNATHVLLVPSRDPLALREAIQIAIGMPEMRATWGAQARAHVVAEHSLEALGKRWEKVCMEVAACAV